MQQQCDLGRDNGETRQSNADLENAIRQLVLEQLDMSREIPDEELKRMIQEVICEQGQQRSIPIEKRLQVESNVFNSLRKMDVLQDLLEDEEITEIMINGYQNIFIEKYGRIFKTKKQFSSKDRLDDIIQQIVAQNNRMVNEALPIVDTRLSDGSRVNIVLPPVAVDGSIVSIRKFPQDAITMEQLIRWNSISEALAKKLQLLVRAKYNIFICGGTGSGKTTFLNALTEFIPRDERVITIEDSAELQLQGVENLVRLEARNATIEGSLAITIRDLVKTSLRMRPDRIIVGECRGAEAIEMLQAANTGHDGSLSSGHSNSPADMISRLEMMVLMGMDIPISAVRKQIASGIDIMIYLGRLRDKTRKVLRVDEIIGMESGEIILQTLYEYVITEEKEGVIWGEWIERNPLVHTQKLQMAGIKF